MENEVAAEAAEGKGSRATGFRKEDYANSVSR